MTFSGDPRRNMANAGGTAQEKEARLKARGAGRASARVIAELILTEVGAEMLLHQEFMTAFVDELLDQVPVLKAHLPDLRRETQPVRAAADYVSRMNAMQAQDWGAKFKMPFGKHRDKCINDVPVSYLDWLVGEEPTKFNGNLRDYLRSPFGQHRYELEAQDEDLTR